VLGLGLLGGAMAWWADRERLGEGDDPDRGAAWRRSWIAAVVVAAVLWLPPIAQQLFGDEGNLAAIVRHFRQPGEPAAGWRVGWGIMGTELGIPGAWLAGGELGLLEVRTSSVLPALLLLAVTVTLGLLARQRGASSAGRLALIALAASAIGVLSGSRITGLVAAYLVRWWWVIAAVVWLSIMWSAWSLLADGRVRRAAAVVSCGALVALSAVMVGRAISADVPNARDSLAIGQLSDELIAELDDGASTYVVDWTDARDWGAVGAGVFLDLDRRGLPVMAAARHALTHGAWRTAAPGAGDGLLIIMGADDLARGDAPPAGAVVVARYEPLTVEERARVDDLRDEIGAELGEPSWDETLVDTRFGRQVLADRGVPARLVDELASLRARGSAYTAYLLRHDG
jgi:hypothetical protein